MPPSITFSNPLSVIDPESCYSTLLGEVWSLVITWLGSKVIDAAVVTCGQELVYPRLLRTTDVCEQWSWIFNRKMHNISGESQLVIVTVGLFIIYMPCPYIINHIHGINIYCYFCCHRQWNYEMFSLHLLSMIEYASKLFLLFCYVAEHKLWLLVLMINITFLMRNFRSFSSCCG